MRINPFIRRLVLASFGVFLLSLGSAGCSSPITKPSPYKDVSTQEVKVSDTTQKDAATDPPDTVIPFLDTWQPPEIQEVVPEDKVEPPPDETTIGEDVSKPGDIPKPTEDLPDVADVPEIEDLGPPPQTDSFTVFFIDVGQGDSILFKTNNGDYVLLDSGPSDSDNAVIEFMTAEGVPKLKAAGLSHSHADHHGEFLDILEAFVVGEFFSAQYPSTTAGYLNLQYELDETGIPQTQVQDGEKFTVDNLTFTFYHPPTSGFITTAPKVNNNSLVAKVCNVAGTCLLSGGDLEIGGIGVLLGAHASEIDVTFLKIHHHGSENGTTEELLDATTPTDAFISVGNNAWEHPNTKTLKLLDDNGINAFRTDVNGTITLAVTGTEHSIATQY